LRDAVAALRRERDELAKVAGALRYDGNRRVHRADEVMARITAERLIRHLTRAGFVLMRSEPSPAPPTAIMPPSTARHRRPALINVAISNLIDKIHRAKRK
jgi:hypothetical protein